MVSHCGPPARPVRTHLQVKGIRLLRLQALAHLERLCFFALVRWEESGGSATSRTPSVFW